MCPLRFHLVLPLLLIVQSGCEQDDLAQWPSATLLIEKNRIAGSDLSHLPASKLSSQELEALDEHFQKMIKRLEANVVEIQNELENLNQFSPQPPEKLALFQKALDEFKSSLATRQSRLSTVKSMEVKGLPYQEILYLVQSQQFDDRREQKEFDLEDANEKLRELETRILAESNQFGSGHPRIQRLKKLADAVRKSIEQKKNENPKEASDDTSPKEQLNDYLEYEQSQVAKLKEQIKAVEQSIDAQNIGTKGALERKSELEAQLAKAKEFLNAARQKQKESKSSLDKSGRGKRKPDSKSAKPAQKNVAIDVKTLAKSKELFRSAMRKYRKEFPGQDDAVILKSLEKSFVIEWDDEEPTIVKVTCRQPNRVLGSAILVDWIESFRSAIEDSARSPAKVDLECKKTELLDKKQALKKVQEKIEQITQQVDPNTAQLPDELLSEFKSLEIQRDSLSIEYQQAARDVAVSEDVGLQPAPLYNFEVFRSIKISITDSEKREFERLKNTYPDFPKLKFE